VGAPGRAGPRLPGGVAGAPPAGHAGQRRRAGGPARPAAGPSRRPPRGLRRPRGQRGAGRHRRRPRRRAAAPSRLRPDPRQPQALPGLLGRDRAPLGPAAPRRPGHLLRPGAAPGAGRAPGRAGRHRPVATGRLVRRRAPALRPRRRLDRRAPRLGPGARTWPGPASCAPAPAGSRSARGSPKARWSAAAWRPSAATCGARRPGWISAGRCCSWRPRRRSPTPSRSANTSPSSPRPASSSRSPGWSWGGPSATTESGRDGCGPWPPAGPRPAACRSSATWSAATPTPC
jgi:hypothetical protein